MDFDPLLDSDPFLDFWHLWFSNCSNLLIFSSSLWLQPSNIVMEHKMISHWTILSMSNRSLGSKPDPLSTEWRKLPRQQIEIQQLIILYNAQILRNKLEKKKITISFSKLIFHIFNFSRQNVTIFASFSSKFFLTIFLVKSKLSTAKKSKTTTFSRVFYRKKMKIFLGNQSWFSGQKMKISNSVKKSDVAEDQLIFKMANLALLYLLYTPISSMGIKIWWSDSYLKG